MKTKRLLVGLFGLLAALAVLTGGLYGQAVESVLLGTVTDASGAAVSGATVTALNKDTGVKYATVSTASGDYRLNNVPVGRYDVSASASGFATSTVADVGLELNHTATINLSLQVGTVNTSVEVTAAAAILDTSTSQLQTTFTTSEAENMGAAAFSKVINGSGIWNLSLMGAGVATSGGVGQGTGPSIGGQRPENNTFSIDGVVNDNHYVTGPQVTVPNDAVAEFTLLQNQFSPEFGGGSGGVFNVLVKSGTNSVHGSIYEYFQNRDLNALDQQQRIAGDTSQPRYDNNRLGATVGGPIVRNKLFYFGDYEYNPLGQAANPAGTVIAPTSAGISALASIPGSVRRTSAFSSSMFRLRQQQRAPSRLAASAFPPDRSPSLRRIITTAITR